MATHEIELPDDWAYGPGVLHGGWLMETVARTALQESDHPHVLAASGHFAAAPRVGAATVEVERLRAGRSVTSLQARLAQDGAAKLEVLLTAGTLHDDSEPFWTSAAPPELPPVDDCVRSRMPEGAPRNGIIEMLDVRLDPRSAAAMRGTPSMQGEVRGWVRSNAGREHDPLFLLTIGDAMPPVTPDLGIAARWVPTVEYTVLVRAVPAPGWLRVVQRARLVQDGWLDEECEVWDERGRLVAQARQLAGYKI